MISVCVPCYEMSGKGSKFITEILESLRIQTFKNFEVVVSDHSQNDNILKDCQSFSDLNIKYLKNETNRGNSSSNINNAILNSNYDIIKPIFQDDFIISPEHLQNIANSRDKWGYCNFIHTSESGTNRYNQMTPHLNKKLPIGVNTVGCPSVIYFTKSDGLLFDESLIWLMDCEFYHRLNLQYGNPHHITSTDMCIRIWGNSVTNQVEAERKLKEETYVRGKHNV